MNINLKKGAILSFFFFLGAISVHAQSGGFALTIKPDKPMPGYKAFLFYKKGPGVTSIDSVAFVAGKFELKGNAIMPQRAVFYVEPANSNFGHDMNSKPGMSVYLESGTIVASGKPTYETMRRAGTPLNNDYQAYIDAVCPFTEKEAAFLVKNKKAMQENDTTAINSLEAEYFKMAQAKRRVEEAFFNNHLGSLISFEWLKKTMNAQQEKSKAIEMFGKMSKEIQTSAAGKAYLNSLNGTRSVEIGMPAPDFTARDLEGEDVSLSSFKGKYVLLDFWASWCIPCRRENPNVLKAYQAYKGKGFTVLAFSFDDSKAAWEKAVAQDALPWAQVSDLAAFYSPIAFLYGIKSIPSNFLIDPQGKIIAMDLRGDGLEKALSKIL